MTKKQLNTTSSKITVSRNDHVTSGILELLSNTILGTPGKLRYQQTEVEKTLKSLANLEFIEIKKSDKVFGTAAIAKREISFEEEKLHSLYVRYLSVLSPMKSIKNQQSISENIPKKRTRLRQLIAQMFTSELEKPFLEDSKKGLYYAYVEKDNILSKNLCESFGFKSVRTILTLLFSRFSPSECSSVAIVDIANFDSFKSNLERFYSDHNFVYTDSISNHGVCFSYQENDKAIAGLRAIPINWKIIEIPGLKGFLIQKILPRIPFLNRIFNPEELKFLAFDSIWYEEGYSNYIEDIMQHSLYKLGFHMGMIWGDEKSKMIDHLLSSNRLGFLHKVNGAVAANLMVRTINMAEVYENKISSKPVFVSAVDMT